MRGRCRRITRPYRGVSGWAARGQLALRPLLVVQGCVLGPLCSPSPGWKRPGSQATTLVRGIDRTGGRPTHSDRIPTGKCSPARSTGPERQTDQRFGWSERMWSPPPESNRRPHPYHRWSARSGDNAAPRSALQNRKWLAVSRIEKWGAARRYAARLLANHWHASRSDAQWWRA